MMDNQLCDHLQRLGLAQYVTVLQENGYKSWTQLGTIREGDFDHLGFKLGHRRRLQRQIATMNGYPQSEALLPDEIETAQEQSRLNKGRKRRRKFLLRTDTYPINRASNKLQVSNAIKTHKPR
ncbi:hypothetical protein DM02DRAFT_619220 [Periconia macrospinosa]|uniref:SAM domain-containing protein n=1 Tax=Periconia macrospinosa TaxID=97972 RepID=A0A2V1D610_9PLEO|nr:hypothetical protein DM02DRAFT_619220 [Periconia macrospinosa]